MEMTINDLFLMIDAAACAVIATSLGTFQRNDNKYSIFGAVMAFVLIIACGSVTILIITGNYITAHPSETIINVMLCIVVVLARGNVMNLFRR